MIDIVLNQEFNDGDFTLFKYNCSRSLQVNDSQIEVKTNYESKSCDKYSSSVVNSPNTLSVSLKRISGCKGVLTSGQIVGIVFGIIGASLVVGLVIGIFLKLRKDEFQDKINIVENEMQNLGQNKGDWKKNESHNKKSDTKWNDFQN